MRTVCEWFQVWFFWGGLTEPLSRPLSLIFLGPVYSRTPLSNSGFALNSRALCSLDSGLALNFQLRSLFWPLKINFGSASGHRVVHESDGPAGRVGSGHYFAGFWWVGSALWIFFVFLLIISLVPESIWIFEYYIWIDWFFTIFNI